MKFRASRSMRVPAFAALIVLLLAPTLARGQDTTTTGVRLGLTYTAGTKPGVIVLPVRDDDDDSLRVIVQRDLDFSDRMTVIDLDHATLSGLIPGPGEKLNFPLFAKFGAALLVRMTPTTQGMPSCTWPVTAAVTQPSEIAPSPSLPHQEILRL